MKTASTVVYPGMFDPLTYGHMALVRRALGLFAHVCVAIGDNTQKKAVFSTGQRVALASAAFEGESRVIVRCFDGLLVDFIQQCGAKVIIRGLRDVADLGHEWPQANVNRQLAPEVETIFLLAEEPYRYVSSTLVKEIALHHGDISRFVAPAVQRALQDWVKAKQGET